jgi:hypothetical protein
LNRHESARKIADPNRPGESKAERVEVQIGEAADEPALARQNLCTVIFAGFTRPCVARQEWKRALLTTIEVWKKSSHLVIQQLSTTLITFRNSFPVKTDFHLPSFSITATHL